MKPAIILTGMVNLACLGQLVYGLKPRPVSGWRFGFWWVGVVSALIGMGASLVGFLVSAP